MTIEMLVGLNVVDDDAYQLYREGIGPILRDAGGGFGYDFKVSEILRSKVSEPINRVFTIHFPNAQAMNFFFANEEYLDIKQKHFEKSVTNTTIMSKWTKE